MDDTLPRQLPTEIFGTLELPFNSAADAEIIARARELASRSKARQTFRAYRTGWAQWMDFCRDRGYAPLAGDAQAVALFLAHLSLTKRLATVRARLAAVAAAHRVAGTDLDLRHSAIATLLDGFKREQGTQSQKQATPLLFEILPRFIAAYDGATPIGARDKAMILIGFGAALRRSELVALDTADIEISPRGLVVRLHRSKTDPYGKGNLLAIHRGRNPVFCPVRALEDWIAHRGREPGPLFTRILKGGRVTWRRLSDQSVSLVVKKGASAMGLDARQFSGHSLRAGLATSAALAGADLAAIMEQTRHKSYDVARRYIRNAEIWRNNVTERLFGRGTIEDDGGFQCTLPPPLPGL